MNVTWKFLTWPLRVALRGRMYVTASSQRTGKASPVLQSRAAAGRSAVMARIPHRVRGLALRRHPEVRANAGHQTCGPTRLGSVTVTVGIGDPSDVYSL